MSSPEPTSRDGASEPIGGAGHAIRVVIADDHDVVLEYLRAVLDSDGDFEVVGEARNVAEARLAVRQQRPAVLVLDINMPGESTLDAIPDLRTEFPRTQIVVLTMHEEPAFAHAALTGGALGYVLKDAAVQELADAVRSAAASESHVSASVRLGTES